MGNCILISASDFSCILYYTSLYSHASVYSGCTEKLSDMILLVDFKKSNNVPQNTLKKLIGVDVFPW